MSTELLDPCLFDDFSFGKKVEIRSGTIIYPNVTVGDLFETGHNVLIRSNFCCGDYVSVGTNSIIDGDVKFGNFIKIASGCYIPPGVRFENRIFLGPNVTFTNDAFPLKRRHEYAPLETKVADNVSFGAGSVVLPGVTISSNCFIAAGAIVTKDVPTNSLVVGHGNIKNLPEHLSGENNALSWSKPL